MGVAFLRRSHQQHTPHTSGKILIHFSYFLQWVFNALLNSLALGFI